MEQYLTGKGRIVIGDGVRLSGKPSIGVTRDVPPGTVVADNPARVVKRLNDSESAEGRV